MNGWDWGLIVWGSWGLLFVVLELLAVFANVPWPTLSSEAWHLQTLSDAIRILVLAGLCVLVAHLVFRFP